MSTFSKIFFKNLFVSQKFSLQSIRDRFILLKYQKISVELINNRVSNSSIYLPFLAGALLSVPAFMIAHVIIKTPKRGHMNFKQTVVVLFATTTLLFSQSTPASSSLVAANNGTERNRFVNRPNCTTGLNGRIYTASYWSVYSTSTNPSEPQYVSQCDGTAWTDYYEGKLVWTGFDTVGAPWLGTAGIPSSNFNGTFSQNAGGTRFNPGQIAPNVIVGRNRLMGWGSSDYTDLHFAVRLNTTVRQPKVDGDIRMAGIYTSQSSGGEINGYAIYQNGMFFGNDGHVYFVATAYGNVVHVSRTKTKLSFPGKDLYLRYEGYFNPGAAGLNNAIGEGFRSKWQYSTNGISWTNGEDFENIFGVLGYGTDFNNPAFGQSIGYGAFKWNASGITPESNYSYWVDMISINYFNF